MLKPVSCTEVELAVFFNWRVVTSDSVTANVLATELL